MTLLSAASNLIQIHESAVTTIACLIGVVLGLILEEGDKTVLERRYARLQQVELEAAYFVSTAAAPSQN